MGIFIIICKALLIGFVMLACQRVTRLAVKDASHRLATQHESLRMEALKVRQRRQLLKGIAIQPEHYINEYINSLLGTQPVLAGTANQADQWVKPHIEKTSKPYPSNPTPQLVADDNDDWIFIKSDSNTCRLREAS